MQIPPTSWTNPAAATQQAIHTQKPSATSSGPPGAHANVAGVENSQKTGDRDADERYDGPEQRHGEGEEKKHPSQDPHAPLSATDLPADDGEISTLDLRG